jgi:hypothetical protein
MLPYFILLVGWLLFPKGFALFVGCWFGAITGGFFWSLVTLPMGCLIGWDNISLQMMGVSFLAFITLGTFSGVILAAKG